LLNLLTFQPRLLANIKVKM